MMIEKRVEQSPIRLHFTNVTGLGASKLLGSLLPSLEQSKVATVFEMHLPDRGVLSEYRPVNGKVNVVFYKRMLPNALSRFLECLFPSASFNDGTPLLVLGDLPLRCKAPQIVFLQNSHLLKPTSLVFNIDFFKYHISRMVFRCSAGRLKGVIVQTMVMKERLIDSYPILVERVYVIPQPVPLWISGSNLQLPDRDYSSNSMLNLSYPAANYPHKNHKILTRLSSLRCSWPISKLTLTINELANPAPSISWVRCVGELNQCDMLKLYQDSDALVFLSKEESFGFPLVEAMYLGLPIICSDLPFARALCGDGAIYFNPDDITSLNAAILDLKNLLIGGWRPNWHKQMRSMPKTWQETADNMIKLCV